jgi:hypothetical protein
MNVKRTLLGIGCFLAISASAEPAPQSTARVQSATLAGAQCTCTSLPFRPDPPCAKFCALEILRTVSTARLKTALSLPRPVEAAVAKAKSGELTESRYQDFIATREGAAFRTALEGAKPGVLQALAEDRGRQKNGQYAKEDVESEADSGGGHAVTTAGKAKAAKKVSPDSIPKK